MRGSFEDQLLIFLSHAAHDADHTRFGRPRFAVFETPQLAIDFCALHVREHYKYLIAAYRLREDPG